MNRKTWVVTITSLALLVLALDLLFVHVLFPNKKRMFLEKLFETPASNILASNLPPGLKYDFSPTEKFGSDDFQIALEACLSDPYLRSSRSPQNLIEKLEKKYGIKKRVFNSENIHFVDGQKTEQRLLITAVSTPEGVTRKLHLFQTNAGQLPTPLEIDPSLAGHPDPESLRSLFANKTIIHDELKETIYFNSEMPVIVEWVDGSPKEFQMVGDKKTLSCQYLHCNCQ